MDGPRSWTCCAGRGSAGPGRSESSLGSCAARAVVGRVAVRIGSDSNARAGGGQCACRVDGIGGRRCRAGARPPALEDRAVPLARLHHQPGRPERGVDLGRFDLGPTGGLQLTEEVRGVERGVIGLLARGLAPLPARRAPLHRPAVARPRRRRCRPRRRPRRRCPREPAAGFPAASRACRAGAHRELGLPRAPAVPPTQGQRSRFRPLTGVPKV